MDLIRQKKREYEPGVDILRVLVLVMVFILHYYFENGFYFQSVSSPAMFFHSLIRTVTVCSVPLFLILTGYLRCAQQYRKGYYRSLLPLLCSYIFVSLLCGLFIMAFEKRQLALSDWVKGITGFEFAEYGWYVNMYIGLFLLSPLVNKLWNALESRENHQKLIVLVFSVTLLSGTVNRVYPLLPDYWNCLWPFAYYLSGCYIKSYRTKLALLRGLGLILACAGAITAINIATGGAGSFNKGYMPDYDEFPCVLLSLLIFCTFYHLDCKSEKAASLFRSLAPRVFTMILVSIIFNTIFFPQRYMLYGPEDYGVQGLWRVALSLFCSWCVAVPVDALSARLCSIPRPSQWREDTGAKLWKALVCAGFLGSFAFLVWKCRYGFGNMDEAFYLSIPIRLCQGEALIVDEWHVSQLSAFLLWPLMSLYRLVFGTSNEGIILNFRYIYVGVQFLCSLFLYKRWKALSKYGAFAAALLFLLFAPYGISALSYNSLGLICISLSVTFAATAEKNIPLQQLLAGLFLACAVLCCPAVAVLYPLYLAAVLVFSLKHLREKRPDILSPAAFCRVTALCLILAVLLVLFLLSRSSLQELAASIPHVLADPEHSRSGGLAQLGAVFKNFFFLNNLVLLWSVASVLCIFLAALDGRRRERAWLWWLTACGADLGLMVAWFGDLSFINAVNAPLVYLPLLAVLLTESAGIRKMFYCLWLPGLLYGLCVSALSNQTYLALQMGLLPANTAAVMIIFETSRELISRKTPHWWEALRAASLVLAAVILVGGILGCTISRRYSTVFWESDMASQRELVADGPQAGLYVSEEKLAHYQNISWELSSIRRRMPEARSVAILSTECWYALFNDWHYGVYSNWLSARFDDIQPRLMDYYDLNPHKLPDMILADKKLDLEWDAFARNYGYAKQGETGTFHVYICAQR